MQYLVLERTDLQFQSDGLDNKISGHFNVALHLYFYFLAKRYSALSHFSPSSSVSENNLTSPTFCQFQQLHSNLSRKLNFAELNFQKKAARLPAACLFIRITYVADVVHLS